MFNADGGTMPRGNPQPQPEYRERRHTEEERAQFSEAAKNKDIDYRYAANLIIMTFGEKAVVANGLAAAVSQLLRVNREMAIRLYGTPVDFDGEPSHHCFINAG